MGDLSGCGGVPGAGGRAGELSAGARRGNAVEWLG